MKRRILSPLLLCWAFLTINAQDDVKGRVLEAHSGEPIPYAQVYERQSERGTLTDPQGFFWLKLPDTCTLYVRHEGFRQAIYRKQKGEQNLLIELSARTLDTIRLTATQPASAGMVGRISFLPQQVEELPALGGEADLLKALTLLPAVSPGKEGSTELNVRGGSRGQNLFILDGVPTYNTGHIFNLFSIFNPDALKQINFYASGFPSQYGGRLSSIVDVAFREGNKERWTGKINLGVISSKLLIEGPITPKLSILFAARSTYLDIFNIGKAAKVEANVWEIVSMRNLGFSDFNLKLNYEPSPNHKLTLTSYAGNDRFRDLTMRIDRKSAFNQYLQNLNSSLTYHWFPNKPFHLKATVFQVGNRSQTIHTETLFDRQEIRNPNSILPPVVILDTVNTTESQSLYSLQDYGAIIRGDYTSPTWGTLSLGTHWTSHFYAPGRFRRRTTTYIPSSSETDLTYTAEKLRSQEWASFLTYEKRWKQKLAIQAGLRLSAFWTGEIRYMDLLPRLLAEGNLGKGMKWQLAYDHTVQYHHLMVRPEQLINHSTWLPATDRIPPQRARQLSLGLGQIQLHPNVTGSSAIYYKWMESLSIFPASITDLTWTLEWEDLLFTGGEGRAYGIETFLDIRQKSWQASLSYTLSNSLRRFDEIDQNTWFPDEFDRRHQLTSQFVWDMHAHWKLSAFWTYSTGFRINLPVDYVPQTNYNFGYYALGPYNSQRMPNYHRLDLALHYRYALARGQSLGFTFSVYNAYFQRNPYRVYVTERPYLNPSSGVQEVRFEIKGVNLFPIIPALNIQYQF